MMIESPKIFRLEIEEEPFVPRVVYSDHTQSLHEMVRVASCHELSAPLRRTILKLRQKLLDRQQEDGLFVCIERISPQSLAEVLLCIHWLGLQDEPSLESMIAECIARLFKMQSASGCWIEESAAEDKFSSTLLVYFSLKRFGVSSADQAMISARQRLLKLSESEKINQVARGYLALYGVLPFDKHCINGENYFSSAEQKLWIELMQRKVHRQLTLSETGIAWLPSDALSLDIRRKFRQISQSIQRSIQRVSDRIKRDIFFHRAPVDSNSVSPASHGFRELFYRAMIEMGPWGRSEHCSAFQQLLKRLKIESVDAVLPADVDLTATCLESLLFSGLSISATAVQKSTNLLVYAPLQERSIVEQAKILRVASLLRESDHSVNKHEVLPPSMQVLSDPAAETDRSAGSSMSSRLSCTSPARLAQLLESQSHDGSWDQCPLTTAEVLTALFYSELDLSHKAMARAIRFLRRTQAADGSWFAHGVAQRTDVTAQVLSAARKVGVGRHDPLVRQGADWLLANQQPGGAWSNQSIDIQSDWTSFSLYDTALSVIALIDCGYQHHASVSLGIDYLLEADTFSLDEDLPKADAIPLKHWCAMLHALSRWVPAEDNGAICEQTAPRPLALLSVFD
ncbi:MAG: prenyltransferase/squalene oxidase repeat-containing protein [Planctomycetota bacterium]|nr:prenyltransferase/squalene oxidase repeat-containing protein [Planctomycetota bacterium]